jgi:hypothetical protein
MPQLVPSQVAVPLLVVGQGMQREPQVNTLAFETQLDPH